MWLLYIQTAAALLGQPVFLFSRCRPGPSRHRLGGTATGCGITVNVACYAEKSARELPSHVDEGVQLTGFTRGQLRRLCRLSLWRRRLQPLRAAGRAEPSPAAPRGRVLDLHPPKPPSVRRFALLVARAADGAESLVEVGDEVRGVLDAQ